MKIILSRKGFDSSIGKVPSPIFDNGDFFSLPIPSSNNGSIPYSSISYYSHNIGCIVENLTKGKIKATDTCHFDPDLNEKALIRNDGWRPLFGQSGAAQGHLKNKDISKGDIFIYYGWFQKAFIENGKYRFDKTTRGFHAIFGWLQIGEIISAHERTQIPAWANYHPHFARIPSDKNDVVYIASDKLVLSDIIDSLPGAGSIRKFSESLKLTRNGGNRSIWELPLAFFPEEGKPPMSYHEKLSKWSKQENSCILSTVGRGQEFVIDCSYYPEVLDWVLKIFKNAC